MIEHIKYSSYSVLSQISQYAHLNIPPKSAKIYILLVSYCFQPLYNIFSFHPQSNADNHNECIADYKVLVGKCHKKHNNYYNSQNKQQMFDIIHLRWIDSFLF